MQFVKDYFAPIPVKPVPLMSKEVVGLERLDEFAHILYGAEDPAELQNRGPAYGFSKRDDGKYQLEIRMPFALKNKIEMTRTREDLVIRIGTFKRNILLPRAIAALPTAGARMDGDKLVVEFASPAT
jgi:arsenite-transporting ATPase